MVAMTVPTVYFEQPGPSNTEQALRVAQQRAEQLAIQTIVVASTSGETGARAVAVFEDRDVVVVTHSTGFSDANAQELLPKHRLTIEAKGGRILTCQHALGGVNRAVRKKLGTYLTDEIIAYTLRVFGEGVKVCAEISMMAADAGLLAVGEPCICIAGTGSGADTAVVLLPTNAQTFFDLRLLEVLAKPRLG